MPQNYIGVYATQEKGASGRDHPRHLGSRKRLWFVWEREDGKYTVQPLNAAKQPMAGPRIIQGKEFFDRYTYEADCLSAPPGTAHPSLQGTDAEAAPLPDLFHNSQDGPGQGQAAAASSTGLTGGIRADDPDLLLTWAMAAPAARPTMADPVSMPFGRLVGEVSDTPESSQDEGEGASPDAAASADEDAQLAERLRAQFVQALLLLRSGAKSESLALLEELLGRSYGPFAGGARLFSEFGLGLRRLGFMQHALTAHKKALEFAPDDARILFNVARTYHDLDRLPEAREYLGKVLAVDPDMAIARQFLSFLDAGRDGAGNEQ